MRIESVKKAGRIAGRVYDFSGLAFKAVVVAGLLAGAIVSQGTLVPQGETSPIGQFLLDNPDQPVDGLGDFLKKLPNITSSKQQMNVKKINLQVAKICNQYDSLVHKYFGVNFALRKAQMFGESSCNSTTVGSAGEIGLFQVKPSTCKDVGVTGDLFDPKNNIDCASRYLTQLCSVHGWCTVE